MAMSQQGSFVSGFLLGTLIGAALGGVVGALTASRRQSTSSPDQFPGARLQEGSLAFGEFDANGDDSVEAARLGLEAKIAQLNEAIDEVRQQLGGINGHADRAWENPSRALDP
jgi:hypothetical protein